MCNLSPKGHHRQQPHQKDKEKMIEQIYDPDLKKTVAREILEALREWFEVDESRKKYIADCEGWIFFAAKEAEKYAGFLCL